MRSLFRSIQPLCVLILLSLCLAAPSLAYPVAVTINLTFSDIGQPDPARLGSRNLTGVLTTTIDTDSGSSGVYPATVHVSVDQLPALPDQPGTVTLSTNGQLVAAFGVSGFSFNATLLTNVPFPTLTVSSFGSGSFSAPASQTSYSLFGFDGTVGVTGAITALGLTASPLSGFNVSATQNGTPPAAANVSVGSNDPSNPSFAYTATVSPSTATWLTLTNASGSTPGNVTANFSTALAAGTYSAGILVDTGTNPAGAITIPVTYTVNAAAVLPPVISSLSPASAAAGGPAFNLTVSGSGFVSGAVVTWNATSLPTTFNSAGQLTAAVPANLIASSGTASVTVTNPSNGGTSSPATFTISSVPPPVISSLSPSSATAGGGGFTLNVNGSGFTSTSSVQWNGTVIPTSFVNSTQMTATVSASLIASAGTASVTVVNPNGATSGGAAFTITAAAAPVISSLSPSSATAGGPAFTLTVNGSSFVSGAVVKWNGTALTTTFGSVTRLTASVPAPLIASAGSASITVTNPSGGTSTGATFSITAAAPPPVISTLSPSSATAGGASFVLTVNGSAFVSGATVNWNGTGLSTVFASATQLTASVPANLIASAGTASVTVTNPNGATSSTATFTISAVPPPVISTLSPSSTTAGGAPFVLTVNGSGFVSGATVKWSGTALSTVFVSATQLTASVPANLIASSGTANVTVTNPSGSPSSAAAFTISAAPAVISSLGPASATAGGPAFTLTVNGTGFVSGAAVKWNGVALSTVFVSATSLTASVSASLIATTGSASVTVANPTGAASNASTFTITAPGAPSITSLNPASATAGGSAFTLTVSGSGFVSGATVKWNGTALATTFGSATQLTASVTAALIATAGNASVTVTNPNGGGTSNGVSFTIGAPPAPAISSLSPASATAGGAAFTLTITGSNFVSEAAVHWNTTALSATFVSSTQITAAVPANLIATAGTASVTVINPNSGGTSNGATFTISSPSAPAITTLSPASATAGGPAFTLTITGSNFVSGAAVDWNTTALSATFVSSTQITASVPANLIASAGTAGITVVNPNNGGTSNAATFTIAGPAAPAISSLNPASANAGGPAFTLTVTGSHFVSGAAVQWNGTALATTFTSSTQLTAAVPATLIVSAGTANVSVTNPNNGGTSNAAPFAINAAGAPALSSLAPSTAAAGGPAFTLTINGSNFVAGSLVQWNGTALTATFVSSSQLTASVPASLIATAGSFGVTVTNPSNGPTSNTVNFTVTGGSPVISGVNPASATASGPAFTLTVNGTGFVSASVLKWGTTALPTTFVSSTQLTVSVAASFTASAGTVSLTVANPTGSPSNAVSFSINAATPAVTSFNPASAIAGSPAFTLTVNGLGFLSGAAVQWNGTALPTTFVSPNQLTVAVPATLIASVSTAKITVANPSGSPSGVVGFPITSGTPNITSLTPASAVVGGAAFPLCANGTGFASGASLDWNGTSLGTPTVQTSTQVCAPVPADLVASQGQASITVVSPSGAVSNAFSLPINLPLPAITSGGIVPLFSSGNSIQPGSWISIYGTSLSDGMYSWNQDFPTTLGNTSVTINGKAAFLWYVSPSQINLQAPDDPTIGAVDVVVNTPYGPVTSTVTLASAAPSFSLFPNGGYAAGVIVTPSGSGAYGGGTYDLLGPAGFFSFSTRPAKAGEIVELYGVGFGPTNPAVPAGQLYSGAAPTTGDIKITIGGMLAQIVFSGITEAGTYQLNVVVPSTGSGDQLLQATVDGVPSPDKVYVTVQ